VSGHGSLWREGAAGDKESRMSEKTLREEVNELQTQLAKLQKRLESLEGREERVNTKVRTFIDDFDDLIGGGIPQGHVCLISGPSGAMKTSIALYALHHNSENGVNPLYISLEETKESLQEGLQSLGLEGNSDFVVDIGRLRTEHMEVEERGNWMDVLRQFITKRRRYRKIELLVIDSVTGLYSLTDMRDPHKELFHFFAFLRDLGITSLLIFDMKGDDGFPDREDSIADGLFQVGFHHLPDGSVRLKLRCAKLRHTKHSMDYHELRFENGRFSVGPLPSSSL
jgi:KaiC/GvpD/RAD55 family RecA-like ATPase